MKKKIGFLLALAVSIIVSSKSVMAVQDLPVMPKMTKAEYNRQMQEAVNEINEANGIDEEIASETAGSYPAKFDPRTTNSVTSVKDQDVWGTCWVYSTIAMVEQNLIKRGYENSSVDLSELHALYFNKKANNIGGLFTTFCANGGNAGDIISDMADGIGPVYESTVPMQNINDDLTLNESLMYQHIYEPHKTETLKTNSSANTINQIKGMITNYGSVLASMYYYNKKDYMTYSYSASTDTNFYFPVDVSYTNHSVVIVGWDDNYAASNFKKTPAGNGAWLVKQSYGTEITNSGYGNGSGFMWMSYYDKGFDNTLAVSVEFTKVGNTPKTITLSNTSLDMKKGQTKQLSATVAPSSALNKNITWKSSNPSVATVTNNGLVVCTGKGSCEITVSSVDGYAEAVCKVTGKIMTEYITAEEMTMIKGQKAYAKVNVYPLDASDRGYTLSSANESIAKVQGQQILAVNAGTTTVTAKATDGSGVTKTFTVNVVTDGIADIVPISSTNATVEVERCNNDNEYLIKFKVTAFKYDSLHSLNYTSSNPNVLFPTGGHKTINISESEYEYTVYFFEYGFGTTDITLYSEDALGKSATVRVTIKQKASAQPSTAPTSPSQSPSQPSTNPCVAGHDMRNVVTKKATMSADGTIETKCARCGLVSSRSTIQRVSEIYLSDGTFTYTGKAIKPRVSVFDAKDRNITNKCSVTYSNNKKVGKAKVRISCNTADYNFVSYQYFNIVPKTSAIKSAKKNGTSAKITWAKNTKQTDGYEIQYSTKKNFAKSVTKKVKVKNNTTVDKTIKKLNAKKTYYVRIRTYKTVNGKKHYSNWSKAVKTK